MSRKQKGFYERHIKRLLDFVLALSAIIILSPVLIITALTIRLKLGSPILFQQQRPGLNGKVFVLYKFRSMTDTVDGDGNLLTDKERLTKFGKKLRATSIDELPELWNIIKGDMSIVGPRPLLVQYLSLYNNKQKHRQDVRPGLTGLAQVNGRNAISWEEKFDLDVKYVNNVKFSLDIKIIIKTLKIVFRKKGIHSETAATMDVFKG